MLALVRDRIRVDPGYLTLASTADWRSLAPGRVSFGHDIETAYLMLDASAALGIANDTTTRRAAKQMVDLAVRDGWDSTVGGFYDEGNYTPGASHLAITHDTKNWWAQAEGLNTLLLFADLYPDDPLRYYDKFVKQWSYIDTYIIDHRYGGWYEGGVDKEPQWRTGLKGRIWKAAITTAAPS
jgi:mannobiose 2-epimerase